MLCAYGRAPAGTTILAPARAKKRLPRGWNEQQYEQAQALLTEGKTDVQIVAAVFRKMGKRRYAPLVGQTAQLRAAEQVTTM